VTLQHPQRVSRIAAEINLLATSVPGRGPGAVQVPVVATAVTASICARVCARDVAGQAEMGETPKIGMDARHLLTGTNMAIRDFGAITNTDPGAAPDSPVPDRTPRSPAEQLAQVREIADFYPAITGR
jgi:hypothetical protein